MKFLANENFPNPSIRILRNNGHYVKSISEELAGIPDTEVIRIAQSDNLIILTFDKDYGELLFRYALPQPPAVIFFRDKGDNPIFAGNRLVQMLADKAIVIDNCFTIIEESNVRQRHY